MRLVGLSGQTVAFLVRRERVAQRNSRSHYTEITGRTGSTIQRLAVRSIPRHLTSRPPRRLSGTNLSRDGINTAGSVCSLITVFAGMIPFWLSK
jgi:hypothetical protein